MHSALRLLGIAKKAGRLEVGEEPVGAAARARQAKLLLAASDAADNSLRRCARFAEAGKAPWLHTPFTKAELGAAVGRSSCAMLALTDVGLAAAAAEKLAAELPQYAPVAQILSQQAAKVFQRQKEQRVHERRLREGGKKPWAPPPVKSAHSPAKPARASAPAGAKRSVPKGTITIKKKTP